MRRNRKSVSILPNLIFSKFFFIFCLVLFVVILFGLAKGTVKNYQINSEIKELEQQISHLENKNQEFGQLINFLKSKEYIEQEAKLKLGYKNKGEKLVVIPETEIFEDIKDPEEKTKEKEISNPAKWWAYFFN